MVKETRDELKVLDIARQVSYNNKGITVKDAKKVIEEALKVIEEELGNGETIKLSDFAKLEVKVHKGFVTHNVATREDHEIKDRGIVTLKHLTGSRRAGKMFIETQNKN